MKITARHTQRGDATGYHVSLSANDTYQWANRGDSAWPCSTLSGHRLMVEVDSNGLADCYLDGEGIGQNWIDPNELEACISDHLPSTLRHLWPTWERIDAMASVDLSEGGGT